MTTPDRRTHLEPGCAMPTAVKRVALCHSPSACAKGKSAPPPTRWRRFRILSNGRLIAAFRRRVRSASTPRSTPERDRARMGRGREGWDVEAEIARAAPGSSSRELRSALPRTTHKRAIRRNATWSCCCLEASASPATAPLGIACGLVRMTSGAPLPLSERPVRTPVA
jgi:hypothetical protein